MLASRAVGRKPVRYIFAMSRRANLANTGTVRNNFVGNSVLLGLSSRSRNRVFVNYTNNMHASTAFGCERIDMPRNCFRFGMAIGGLLNKRDNSSVGGKRTGTGGILGHFLLATTRGCSLCLACVRNNGGRGTVPHRTYTLYTIPVGSGRDIHISFGIFTSRMRTRCTTVRAGTRFVVRSASTAPATVSGSAVLHLLHTLRKMFGNIFTVDGSIPKLIRASDGLTSIHVTSNRIEVILSRHDSTTSKGGSITSDMHTMLRLTNTRIRINRNCPN